MQWNKQELLGIINQGPKAIINNIIPYLDSKENDDIEKDAILRKISSIIVNNKHKLAFAEKEYLFNYFHKVYIKGVDVKRIGLADIMLSKLMADKEIIEATKEDVQQYLEHNRNIANFSKELDEVYGFCENTASKLIHYDASHLANVVERCMSRMVIDEKPKGLLVALELVNLNQMKTAINILIELAKKGRATEVTSFIHRILPKINGTQAMILKILKLNLQQLQQDEFVSNNPEIKEYILYAYLNAVEVFVEANYIKEGGELLYELYNKGWFIEARTLVSAKFTNIANKIIVLDANQKTILLDIAQKLNLKIYTKDDMVSIGKEIKAQSSLDYKNINIVQENTITKDEQLSAIEINEEVVVDDVLETEISIENISEVIDKAEEVLEEDKEDILDIEDVDTNTQDIENINKEVQEAIETSNNEDNKQIEEILETVLEPLEIEEVTSDAEETSEEENDKFQELIESLTVEESKIEESENAEEITEEHPEPQNTIEENDDKEEILQEEDTPTPNNETDDIFLEILNQVNQEDVVTANDSKEVKEAEALVEDKQPTETTVEEIINQESLNENATISTEDIEDKQDDSDKINLNNILNISQADIDKHFEKIKNITMLANEKAEKIKERVENMDFSNSKSVERIKDIAKKISVFKWKK